MPDMGKVLKQLRQEKGMTLEDVGRVIGVKKAAIFKYEAGLVENMKRSTIQKLSEFFDVSPAYIMGFTDDRGTNEKNETLTVYIKSSEGDMLSKYRTLNDEGKDMVDGYTTMIAETPKYTETPLDKAQTSIIYYDTPVSAGTGQYLDGYSYIMLDLMETPPKGAEFVIRVCGDSMEPTYKDGDKLYVAPKEQVKEGEIGIFSINGNVYVKECGAGQLISHNEKYAPIQIGECDNVHCFGKVVGMCKKYR